jgi:hypothetical protein
MTGTTHPTVPWQRAEDMRYAATHPMPRPPLVIHEDTGDGPHELTPAMLDCPACYPVGPRIVVPA